MASLTNVLPPSTRQQTPVLLIPTSQPIPLLSTPLAKGYGYAYTAGILVYYYLRAGALVRDPLSTLIQDILPLATFQSLFCAICLPVSGAWNSGTGDVTRNGKMVDNSAAAIKKTGATSGTGSVRKRLGAAGTSTKGAAPGRLTSESVTGGPWQSRIMPTILSLILAITIPPTPLAILALVLGAPIYPIALVPHTFALAIHVSLLGFLPIFYTHGVSSTAWRDVAAAWLPFDEAGVWGGAVGTMVGGWVGAIPIALDWDREWQKWPCTVVWGAALGWSVGRLLTSGLKLGVGTRINLSVSSSQQEEDNHLGDGRSSNGDKQK